MLTAMVIVFLVGYLMIALEHPLKINKAGTALLIGTVLWVMYTYAAPFFIPRASAEEFSLFLESFPSLGEFFPLEFIEDQGELMEECGIADDVHIRMLCNEFPQTLHGIFVGFRLAHIKRCQQPVAR